MAWSDFRAEYSTLQLTSLGKQSAQDAESRLDIAERIVRPRQLRDMGNGETLHRLQSELLFGADKALTAPPGQQGAPQPTSPKPAAITLDAVGFVALLFLVVTVALLMMPGERPLAESDDLVEQGSDSADTAQQERTTGLGFPAVAASAVELVVTLEGHVDSVSVSPSVTHHQRLSHALRFTFRACFHSAFEDC